MFFKGDKFLESKQSNRSKSNSHFLGELERKSGDNIGNGSGDESITKIEISKSTESKGSFSKAKKVPSFQENSLALKMRAIRTYETSWKEKWGFYETFKESTKGGHKGMRKLHIVFVLNQGRI